ncbi:MAG: DUF177 domain-containing protein [Cytophagaceae bacterium]|nr:DUF177 domain-containing protein [Cytophagaceae bacterium]
MKVRRQFDLDILKLRNGIHHYGFDIEDSFFEEFKDSFIEKGRLKVKLSLNKSETLIQAEFEIQGRVELTCDRSLEKFDYSVDVTNHLIFKYGNEFSELTEEIITIPRDLPTLNVAQYIYEFIGLAVPMKKLHPRFQNEQGEETEEEAILVYTTKKEGDEEDEETENTDEKEVKDPRWEILNNLKKNLN